MGTTTAKLPEGGALLEASWEVCNKVGGIHTVLTTKMANAQGLFGDRYLAIGPKTGDQALSFHPQELPPDWQPIVDRLNQLGISLEYGTWLTDGSPQVVLIDATGLAPKLDEYKQRFWEEYQLDSLNASHDVDEPLLWSLGVGHFVQAYADTFNQPVTFHGHEWLCAGAFLLIKHDAIRTIFTTHATILGRSLVSRGVDIYSTINEIKPDEAATMCDITTKFQLERLCAKLATIFTTVSHITAREATSFLGREPDVLTENGVDPQLFPDFDELTAQRRDMRKELEDFVAAYFFPSYRFDLRQTRFFFTMGRYETHNKGYDLALKSLSQLNEYLKHDGGKMVVACFFVPGDVKAPRKEILFQQAVQERVAETLHNYTQVQQRELYASLWEEGEHCANVRLLPQHVIDTLKRLIMKLPVHQEVPVCPFELNHPDKDDITRLAAEYGLKNRAEDRVKVLLFPAYFDGFDGIFNRSLYQIISGCDLGFFPSVYEPWGYTPMESLIMGLPAITSNLAGFGISVAERGNPEDQGVFLLERDGVSDEKALQQLTSLFSNYIELPEREQLHHRMRSYFAIQNFRWDILYDRYIDAYNRSWGAPAARET